MKIIRASVLGFCFGVRRAVELAEKALSENKDKAVYSLGPLIHNESVLNELGEKGLKALDESRISEIPSGSVVIIRAHGVAPQVIEALKNKSCIIIDATCPRVMASQKMVQKYKSSQDLIVLTGDRNHGEVKSIEGYASAEFCDIQNYQEAEDFVGGGKLSSINTAEKHIILLSQTTFSPVEFEKVEKLFRSRFENLSVMNTVCPATNERQEALLELCAQVDGVLVVGGKNSANTKRLYQTAASACHLAAHIQSAKEIPEEFFKLTRVGITAGASTPDYIIEEVETELKRVSSL